MEQLATTENLLHPRQVSELKEEKTRLESMITGPAFIRNQLADNGVVAGKRLREVDAVLTQAAKPIPPERIDEAVNLESSLRETWLKGMPTQAEMRRNVAGAVDKNLAWNKRTKDDVLKWRHLRRRLHATGISSHRLDEENDISNIELYRPVGGAQELNMQGEQIQGAMTWHRPNGAGPVAVMSDEDEAYLRKADPELLETFGLLSNDDRAEVLALVRRLRGAPAAPAETAVRTKGKKKARKPRKPMSAVQRAQMGERLARGKALAKTRREAALQPAAEV